MDVIELEKEIKKILSGNVIFEENRIVAKDRRTFIGSQGVPNGWTALMLAGMRKKEYDFQCTQAGTHAFEEGAQVLATMGKRCRLRQLPDAEAVLRRNGLGNPLVLVLERRVNQLHLTIYTARSAMADANCAITLKGYVRHLPDSITLVKLDKEARKKYRQEQKEKEKEQKKKAKNIRKQKTAEEKLEKEQKRIKKEQERRKKELERRKKALEKRKRELELKQQELETLQELQEQEEDSENS